MEDRSSLVLKNPILLCLVCMLSHFRCVQLCATPLGLQPAWLLYPWDSPGKNTGVGCHALLQVGLPDPGIEHVPPASPALASRFFTISPIIMFSTLKIFKYYVIDNDNQEKKDLSEPCFDPFSSVAWLALLTLTKTALIDFPSASPASCPGTTNQAPKPETCKSFQSSTPYLLN